MVAAEDELVDHMIWTQLFLKHQGYSLEDIIFCQTARVQCSLRAMAEHLLGIDQDTLMQYCSLY